MRRGWVGLKTAYTGDTLCDQDHEIILESTHVSRAGHLDRHRAKTKADQEKLGFSLQKLMMEDPSFQVRNDEETGQTPHHFGRWANSTRDHRRPACCASSRSRRNVRSPHGRLPRDDQHARRSRKAVTSARPAAAASTATVWITVEPSVKGKGFEFVNKIVGGSIPREYIPAVEKGIVERPRGGVIAGYPVVDVTVSLIEGSYHEVDSSEMAFKIAGSMAFKAACKSAGPILLRAGHGGPKSSVPRISRGDVIGDLSSRRGRIQGIEARGNTQVIGAHVPLAQMFGYATDLRSKTQGRATYTMQFDHYEPAPQSVSEEVIAKGQGRITGIQESAGRRDAHMSKQKFERTKPPP